MDKVTVIQDDILRYKKNKFAANFALLGLVFCCLYFTLLYTISAVKDIFNVWMGFSVIFNLLVLLIGFYASEGIKAYNKKFSIVLFVLAAVQLIRIIYYPAMGMANDWIHGNYYFGVQMSNAANGTLMIIYLVCSAACFIVSGVQGFIVARKLEVFQKKLDNGEISVEQTLAEMDEEERAAAVVSAEAANETSATEEPATEVAAEAESAPAEGDEPTQSPTEEDNNG